MPSFKYGQAVSSEQEAMHTELSLYSQADMEAV